MKAMRVNPDRLMKPLAAYHQVVRKGSTVAVAGMVGIDSDGNIVGEGDIVAQTRKSLENMQACLEAVGATMNDVIKTTIYLTDLEKLQGYERRVQRVFGRNCAGQSDRPRGPGATRRLLVEIEALAIVGDD